MTTTITDISDHYVEQLATLDPVTATFEGVPGHDDRLTDYSPDGIHQRLEHARSVLRALAGATVESEPDRVAAEVLRAQVQIGVELTEADEDLRPLRTIASPVSDVRICFDLMGRDTEADWEAIVARTAAVPAALDGLIASLREGTRRGVVAAQRQAAACARQADTWGGHGDAKKPFFLGLVDELEASKADDATKLRGRLEEVAKRATEAYAALSRFLVDEYLPGASQKDAVGADRYKLLARASMGTDLDLEETYEWGWDELHRIERAMGSVAERILPSEPMTAVIEHLEHDPTRMIKGEANLRAWLQELMDQTMKDLNGTHFDIPKPVQRVDAMIAPPGGAPAMYYTGPSEDFTRPGRTWYPTQGRTEFPLWGEVSTCYHEGVPGHHLQIGMTRFLTERLNRFQRTLASNSGHAEGWALYAERLMGELGYLDDPAFELGMLRAQAMRAVRVVVDLGLHLQLAIPTSDHFHPGETWTPELALAFAMERSHYDRGFMEGEIDRYLGWPAQAISYKVGERFWLAGREEVRTRLGAKFDLKQFHTQALELGPLGLDQLRDELRRIGT